MPVAVVQVGIVGMAVGQRGMLVCMHMRLAAVPGEVVGMLVVDIMPVRMGMVHRRMLVVVGMVLTQVQPPAQAHQRGGQPETPGRPTRQDQQRQRRAATACTWPGPGRCPGSGAE